MNTMRPGRARAASSWFLLSLICVTSVHAQRENMVVADFDGGRVETVPGLALVVLADEQLGGTSTANLVVFNPGATGSKGALRISFNITSAFPAPFDGVWALLGTDGMPTDVSAYRGVRFQARSKNGTFLAGVGQFAGRTAFYIAPFDVTPEWAIVEIPFEKFRLMPPPGAPPAANPAPLVPNGVVSLTFNVSPQLRGQFDLEIDQVELYR
jgi:hypothetical protein